MSTATKSLFPKLSTLFASVCVLFSCVGNAPSLDSSSSAREKQLEGALLRKRIIEEQYLSVKESLGLGIYDYKTLGHYRYNRSAIVSFLEKEKPELDLSLLKEAVFPAMDYPYLLSEGETEPVRALDPFGKEIALDSKSFLVQVDFSYLDEWISSLQGDAKGFYLSLFQEALDELSAIITPYSYHLVEDIAPYKEGFHTVLVHPDIAANLPSGSVGNCVSASSSSSSPASPFDSRYDVDDGFEIQILDSYWQNTLDISTKRERSGLVRIFRHELGHTLGLADLYEEGEYHPGTGPSIMYALGEDSVYYSDRDKKNLSYVYGGDYASMLLEKERMVRSGQDK